MRKVSDDESAFSHTASKVERQECSCLSAILLKIFVFNAKSPRLFKIFAQKSCICYNFICIFLLVKNTIKLDNFQKASYN